MYEFLRNSKLDSRSYFAATRPAFKFNQFGFTLGGPIQIPKIYNGKNRTFFFFNYEGFQQRRAATQERDDSERRVEGGRSSLNLNGRTPLPPIYDPYTERQTGVECSGTANLHPATVPQQPDSRRRDFRRTSRRT